MPRLHLFEFEDFAWFPTQIRNYGTDFLQFVSNKFNLYKGIAPVLAQAVKQSGKTQIIDLASGGGGGLLTVAKTLKEEIPELKITLTDYYPNISAFEAAVEQGGEMYAYEPNSVNALDVPAKLDGFRTQFLSFHHFRPQQAQQILQNAVDRKAPIAIFEAQDRIPTDFLKNLLSPVTVLLVTPFIRPFKLGRIIFTYLIPIVPLFVMWDGVVSVLRTYRVKEMQAMVEKLEGAEGYQWDIDKNKDGPTPILYLIGIPE